MSKPNSIPSALDLQRALELRLSINRQNAELAQLLCPSHAPAASRAPSGAAVKRFTSAATKAKMSAAAKARWAKRKGK